MVRFQARDSLQPTAQCLESLIFGNFNSYITMATLQLGDLEQHADAHAHGACDALLVRSAIVAG